jgi:cardiolipin synthase (CMP-forming)
MASRTLTSANQITILRLVFIPVFAILEMGGRYDAALAILAVAAISDIVDGYVARAFHQETPLGVALDPIADKLLMATGFVILAFRGALPWWLAIMVLSRDVGIIVTALLISLIVGYRPFRPTRLGKASTVMQVLMVLVAVGSQVHFPLLTHGVVVAGIYSTAAITVASGIHYLLVVQQRYAQLAGEDASAALAPDADREAEKLRR